MSKEWSVTFYSQDVENRITKLPKGILAKCFRFIMLMKNQGPNLGMPHTKHMGKGLIEMRIKAVEGIGRVFYVTVVQHEIVILHSIIKKTDKTPKKDLDIAYQRLIEVKNETN